jgi:hypothetical protein
MRCKKEVACFYFKIGGANFFICVGLGSRKKTRFLNTKVKALLDFFSKKASFEKSLFLNESTIKLDISNFI